MEGGGMYVCLASKTFIVSLLIKVSLDDPNIFTTDVKWPYTILQRHFQISRKMTFNFQPRDPTYFEAWPPTKCNEKGVTAKPKRLLIPTQQPLYLDHLSMFERKKYDN